MVNDGMSFGAGDNAVGGGFTEQDLLLGKTAVKFIRALCVVGFVACVGIALFGFMNVPWDTRMPYAGTYDRSGSGIPMQIAMLPCLVVLFGAWRGGRKSDAQHMRKGSRVGLYILGPGVVVAGVIGQWIMGETILNAGGYFAG